MGKSKTRALNDRQRAFVEFYLTCWNASEAARRAGYKTKANVAGAENLANPSIRAEIEKRLKELHMGADEVLARLSAHASGDVSHFVSIRSDGGFDFDMTTDEARAHLFLVKKLKQKRRLIHRRDNEPIEEIETEFELHDPQNALVQLGRHHKLFVDRMRAETWEDDVADLVRAGDATIADVKAEFGDEITARIAARVGLLPGQE